MMCHLASAQWDQPAALTGLTIVHWIGCINAIIFFKISLSFPLSLLDPGEWLWQYYKN